jgi:uncharacterized protein YdhG (YjbR/CyaY superfamily)
MQTNKATNIDMYIADFSRQIQELLQEIRFTIAEIVPDAKETINYGIPTFTLNNGNLVHFAAYKNHIGFYPGASGIAAFKDELSTYKTAKGSAQFPLNKPIPIELITKIVKYRVKENMEKARKKTK